MAGSNTSILIKRSLNTATPSSLKQGELAYSYNSNTIFLGSPTGDGAIKIGGQYYTDKIDNATDAATGNTLVLRDSTGNVSFNYIHANIIGTISGTAEAATKLATARDFSISGGDITASAVSFDGTGNVTLNAALNSIDGLTAGSYGSSTAIPVVTVAANGRVTSISTSSISTEFTLNGDSGTTTISGGDTLTVVGGQGITTTANTDLDTITIDVDNTVVRSNTAMSLQTIDGDVTIAGNLIIQGTHTTINTTSSTVEDPILYLAANNYSSDAVDIGIAANYYDGATQRHTGFFRDAGTKEYYVFDNYTPELSGNNAIDVTDASFNKANVNAGYIKATGVISNGVNLNNAITIVQGVNDGQNTRMSIIEGVNVGQNTAIGTADTKAQSAWDTANGAVYPVGTLSNGQVLIGAGSNNVTVLANSSYTLTGTLGASKAITSFTVDAYGRVTAATAADIAIAASQITSGTLGVARGGTGTTSFTSGEIVVGNGTGGLQTISNTSYTATGTGASNNTISSLTVDAYGRLTAATFGQISGLTVGQGGTGRTTFTSGGIVYGNSTDGLLVTAAAGTSDQTFSNQILTVTNTGVPVWTNALDGGTF
jgi:hypothetical protein